MLRQTYVQWLVQVSFGFRRLLMTKAELDFSIIVANILAALAGAND